MDAWTENTINNAKIEKLWKDCNNADFKDKKLNNMLFQTCAVGRNMFWRKAVHQYKKDFPNDPLPPKVVSYERAIMLLEKEEKYEMALALVEDAIENGIPIEWYEKRRKKLLKMLGKYPV